MTKSKSKRVKRKYVPLCFQKKKKCASLSELLKTGSFKKRIHDLRLKNKHLAKELEASQCRIAEQTKAMQKMSTQQNQILLAQAKVADLAKLMKDVVSALVEVRSYLDIEFCNDLSTQTKPEPLCRKFPSMDAIHEVSVELDSVRNSFKTPSPPTVALDQPLPAHHSLSGPSKAEGCCAVIRSGAGTPDIVSHQEMPHLSENEITDKQNGKKNRKSSGSKKNKQGSLTPKLVIESPILHLKKSHSRRQSSLFRKSGSQKSKSSGKGDSPRGSSAESSASKHSESGGMLNSPEIPSPSDAAVCQFEHSFKSSDVASARKSSVSNLDQATESSPSWQHESRSMVNSPEMPIPSNAAVGHFAAASQFAKDLTDMELTEILSINPIIVYNQPNQNNVLSSSDNQRDPVSSVSNSLHEKSFKIDSLPNSVPLAKVESRPDPDVPQSRKRSTKAREKPVKKRKNSRNTLKEDFDAQPLKASNLPLSEPSHDLQFNLRNSFSSPPRRSRRKRVPKIVFSPSPKTPRKILKVTSNDRGSEDSPAFSVFASPCSMLQLPSPKEKPRSADESHPGHVHKELPAGKLGIDETLNISTPRLQLDTPESKRVSFAPTDIIYKFIKKSNLKDSSAQKKVRRASKSSFIESKDAEDQGLSSDFLRISTLSTDMAKKKNELSNVQEESDMSAHRTTKITDFKISSLNGPSQKEDLSPAKTSFLDGQTELYTLTQNFPVLAEASRPQLAGENLNFLVNPSNTESDSGKLIEHESINRKINFDDATELYTFTFSANQNDCLKENGTLAKKLINPTKIVSNSQKLPENESTNDFNDETELYTFSFPVNQKDCLKKNGTFRKQIVDVSKIVCQSQKLPEQKNINGKMNFDDETELYTFSFPANQTDCLKENGIKASNTIPVNTLKRKNFESMKENVVPDHTECKAVKSDSKKSSQCFLQVDDLLEITHHKKNITKKSRSSSASKKSSSLSRTTLSAGQRDSDGNSDTNAGRLSRRGKAVSYKEPSLNRKMRRE